MDEEVENIETIFKKLCIINICLESTQSGFVVSTWNFFGMPESLLAVSRKIFFLTSTDILELAEFSKNKGDF